MASLTEIASVARTVEVRGVNVDVFGVSGEALVNLMVRFPEIGKMMSGVDVSADALSKLAPTALSAFIAAGCGKVGDAKAEEIAGSLGVGEQIELLEEILRLTFPRGIGPFVARLEALGVLATVGLPVEAGDVKTASQQPSQSSSKN